MFKITKSNRHSIVWHFYQAVFMILLSCSFLWSGTTGKLAGRVFDENNEPLVGVNIIIQNSAMGASSDIEGFYYIINIPAGTYDVEFSFIGYKTRIVKDV
ncbi:MAG: carboxypeptidase-like regulatory domain-containing protein, partial [Calditrichaeota bacterium]|nr:carboxypeptidase-like regulatory domain-containing protein [Calditrichota bacterium]